MAFDLSEIEGRARYCRLKIALLRSKIKTEASAAVEYAVAPFMIGTVEVKGWLVEEPSLELRSDVGMIVNEQRAILDSLACALAIRNGANNINDVSFPIVREKSTFFNKVSRQKSSKISASDRNKIEDLKPWRPSLSSPEDGNEDLFLLHEVDKLRKHRRLLSWGCLGGLYPLGDPTGGFIESYDVIFDKKSIGIKSIGIAGLMPCDIAVETKLVFSERQVIFGKDVLQQLEIFNDVLENIINQFR